MTLRIAHVLPALTKGGAERVAVDLANAQAAAGHDVTLIVGAERDPALLRDDVSSAVAIQFLIPRDGSLRQAYRRIPGWLRVNREWLRSCDILHCHLTFGSVFGTLARSRRRRGEVRPAVVETYHAVGMPIPATLRWFHAANAARRDGLALMAADDYWDAFAARRPRALVRQIANGVAAPDARVGDARERQAYRRAAGIPDSADPVVGTVGQLRDDRQPWALVAIFADIAAAIGNDVHFAIAGEGPARPRVEAAIVEHGLQGRVHLLGQVASSAWPVAITDLYITLAVGPIVGLAGLEAAFAGVPLIALQLREDYDPPATDWVWSARATTDVAAHAAALLRDPAALAALAVRQQDTARDRFGVSAMAHAYDGLYRAALARLA